MNSNFVFKVESGEIRSETSKTFKTAIFTSKQAAETAYNKIIKSLKPEGYARLINSSTGELVASTGLEEFSG